jgi:hydrogenase maturation protease
MQILVLGVGNILFRDEGVGVRAVESLLANYDFSDNVTLMDGGTLGSRLIGPMMEADFVLVLDAVLGGDKPGTLYRYQGQDLRRSLAFQDSMHQANLIDTLTQCELIGKRPDALIVGIEPEDFKTMDINISPLLASRLPAMCDMALAELRALGGEATPKA